MPHVDNKQIISEEWKFGWNKQLGLQWTMNGMGKPFRKKNRIQKIGKNTKNQVKLGHSDSVLN